ncbi:transcriptional regulator [Candidatus Gastranaerophilus sp. (ex Termes propinquus)]|nr:transcriptional regulator [Candidatus Gastranaerophilus sp. (ex Termes propinquus)]
MNSNNTIVIVSNKSDLIASVTSKLVLLRDLDKVLDTNHLNALQFLRKHPPSVILMHCEQGDKHKINLIRDIKNEPLLKNVSIVIIGNMLTKEFLLEAFDAGISDIMHMPVQEHELLMRVIWSISRNEASATYESRSKFLATLGIIQEDTGFYTQLNGEVFLINEVDTAVKNQSNTCLMFVAPNERTHANNKDFWDVVKKSIRSRDSVAISNDGRFYIFLPKTKLNGAYAVFERMNANFKGDIGVSASVIEIGKKPFREIRTHLEQTLQKASESKKTLLVAPEETPSEELMRETVALTRETVLQSGTWFEARPLDESNEAPEEELQMRLFKQTYRKKSKLVIEPVFKKYLAIVAQTHPDVEIDKIVEKACAKFVLRIKGASSSFYITHSGTHKIKMELQYILNGEIKKSDIFDMELTDLNFQKLSEILTNFCTEFSNLVSIIP